MIEKTLPISAPTFWRIVSVALTLVLVTPGALRADDAILWTPLDTEWEWLAELARRGDVDATTASGWLEASRFDAASDPGSTSSVRALLGRFASARRLPHARGASLQLRTDVVALSSNPTAQLRPRFLDVRTGDGVDPTWRHRTQFVGALRLHERVVAALHFRFDSHGDNDPLERTPRFHQLGASNNFDAAWIRATFGPAAFTLGRRPLAWGPERLGGLLLSAQAPAPDMIHVALDWGPHRLQSFAGQLSTADVEGVPTRRWLYGHRADFFFLERRLRVALSETAVVAGESESLNLRYFNPIPLWAQIQVEDDGDTGSQVNVIDALDGEFRHGLGTGRVRWYGSLAVDDFQIDAEGRKRSPDQLAWTAGCDVAQGAWLAGYEYRRIGSWTYLHRGRGSGHTNFGRPLGAPEGPDTDRHHLQLERRLGRAGRLWLSGERARRGVNRIDTTDPIDGNAGAPYPFGRVEKRWIAAIGTEWTWMRSNTAVAHLGVEAALHGIENLNNRAGVDEEVWELRALLHLRAPTLHWRVD